MKLDISSLQADFRSKKYSVFEFVEKQLSKIQTQNQKLNAILTVTNDFALNKAKEADINFSNGQIRPLEGITLAVKDIFLTQGIRTTSGSKVLENYIPQYSSTVYQRLENAGAILVGKTNTDTFAFGASTENSGYGPTRNPWDLNLIPGGSSGGSAAAQAAGLCVVSTGTDTGGSIRQPSSMCSVSGIKPTYGRNSRYGITAMASSFDCPGFFANNVADLATLLQITANWDPHDATSSKKPVPNYPQLLNQLDLKTLTIGLPKEYFGPGLDSEVKETIQKAISELEKSGVKFKEVSLPKTNLGIAVYYILVPCEISSNMARYDGLRFGSRSQDMKDLLEYYLKTRGQFMEPEMKRRIIIGTYCLSAGYYDAYYHRASQVRQLIRQEFAEVFEKVDLLLTPASPTPAWPIGQKNNDPLAMYMADVYTVCANVAQIPGLVIPSGFTSKNLPVGLQLLGPHFSEDKLFSLGHQFQQLTNHHQKEPIL